MIPLAQGFSNLSKWGPTLHKTETLRPMAKSCLNSQIFHNYNLKHFFFIMPVSQWYYSRYNYDESLVVILIILILQLH